MTEPNNEDVSELVALLDAAVKEIRSGQNVDPAGWGRQHPEYGDQGIELVQTLRILVQATEDWRNAAQTIVLTGVDGQLDILPHHSVSEATVITSRDESDPTAAVERAARGIPQLIGRYEVETWIGSGAMGDVYRAHDPQLDRTVAIKVPKLDRHTADQDTFTHRFLREARNAAAVRHPHVCTIYDAGQEAGTPFVVMAYITGETLSERLKRDGRYDDPREAVALTLQIAEALQEVHQHGIIHRDLKPGNILLDRAGNALLTDFGLARSILVDERMTANGGLVGTPAYMSPEQALGERAILGPESDLYSLGVVLYELLSGKLPFTGGAASVIVNKAMRATPSPLSGFRPDLDPQLVAIVESAIRHEPSERFPSAAALAQALKNWLVSQATPARNLPGAAKMSVVPQAVAGPQPRGRQWIRTQPRSRLIALAACLAVIPGLWLAIWGTSPDSGSQTAAVQASKRISGKLKIRFIGAADAVSGTALARRATEGDERPLFNGQTVQLQISLSLPGYAYLIWIDSDGLCQPIYPWDFGHSKQLWAAPRVSGSENPAQFILCPRETDKAFVATGKPGMQHVVLLVRTCPWDSDDQLQAALSGLPASPLPEDPQMARYFDWSPATGSHCGQVRGLAAGELAQTGEIEEQEDPTGEFDESEIPLLAILKDRLRPYGFDLIKIWRFAQTAE
jgi:serine/threonine protein kinase